MLIVAPNERDALTAVMGKAMEAGIPVICLERDIVQPNYTTYIRMDNRAIGRMAGQFIVDQLTKKNGAPSGNVVFLRGLLGVEAEINRDGGAREILSRYPDIHIVADPVANWIQAEAHDRMTEVLRVQPKIDVVYGHNDPMAIGAYLAAKELGRDKEMIFTGVDGLGGPVRRHQESDGRRARRHFRLSAGREGSGRGEPEDHAGCQLQAAQSDHVGFHHGDTGQRGRSLQETHSSGRIRERAMGKNIFLVANGDLRLSANQKCWPVQAEVEAAVIEAIKAEGRRRHPRPSL